MVELYFGCNDGSAYRALSNIAMPINVMVNYASKVRSYPPNTKKRFLDSGGYSFFCRSYEYDNDLELYLKWAIKHKVDYFVNRDYPCEPNLLKLRKTTVLQNQMKTLNNQILIENLIDNNYPMLFNRFVAVLQGWELEDYIFMADMLNDQGLITDLIGIGSICRRHSERELKKIIIGIKSQFPCLKLHGFGIKFTLLKDRDIWNALQSVDSGAYRYNIFKGEIPQWKRIQDKALHWIELYGNLKKQYA